ncbi:MAG TPA: hypothetical protein EYP86_00865, partial [Candidatus Altiarchaeales archaeon]|nr:hypothetical protein [Candidatus Altiarchaeales archaeon]
MKRYVVILILIGILNGIVVVNADDLEKLWEYRIVEDVYKVNIKDVNADGQMEILMAGKDRTQYGRDKIYLLNSRGDLMLKIEVENLRDFYLADAYGDSRDEIIVSYGRIVNNIPRGGLYIFDLEGNVLSEYPKGMLKSNIVLNNIVATDIDRDYRNEIVGNSKEGIYVFDDTYDGILWRWMSGRTIRNTVVEDIFEDTLPEIITIGVDEVNVFSHDGLKKWNYSMPEGVLSVGTVDYDILGYKEVVIASSNRSVHILDVNGGFRDKFVLDGDILNMVVEDTNNDLDDDLVFGTDNGI